MSDAATVPSMPEAGTSMLSASGVRAGSLTQAAYAVVLERLVLLDIAPGAPVNEKELAQNLGMGRTPLREALKRLEIEHLVISYPRRGTFATPVDITVLSQVSELRRALEPVVARRAARVCEQAGAAELQSVRRDICALGEANSLRDQIAADMRVHRVLYRLAGNPLLEEACTEYLHLSSRIWSLALRQGPAVGSHIAQHTAVLDAVIDGEAELAADLMAQHVDEFESAVRRVL